MDQCCGISFVVTSGKSLFLIHFMFHVVEPVREAYTVNPLENIMMVNSAS